jgi:hypothetical protein
VNCALLGGHLSFLDEKRVPDADGTHVGTKVLGSFHVSSTREIADDLDPTQMISTHVHVFFPFR